MVLFLRGIGAETFLVIQASFTYWYLTAAEVWCTPHAMCKVVALRTSVSVYF